MRTRSRRLLVAFLAILLLAVAVHGIWPREPAYSGKTLSAWLADLRYDDGFGKPDGRAVEALRHIGPKAYPRLARMAAARDSRAKMLAMKIADAQDFLPSPFTSAETKKSRALAAFKFLGPEAKGAAPALLAEIARQEPSADLIMALLYVDPWAAVSVMPGLEERSGNRLQLVGTLGGRTGHYPDVIPLMIECLKSKHADTRATVAVFLGLRASDPAAVPVLAGCLADPDEHVRIQAAWALGSYQTMAKSAVPSLLRALEDTDATVRSGATNSLRLIDPEALAQAGSKPSPVADAREDPKKP